MERIKSAAKKMESFDADLIFAQRYYSVSDSALGFFDRILKYGDVHLGKFKPYLFSISDSTKPIDFNEQEIKKYSEIAKNIEQYAWLSRGDKYSATYKKARNVVEKAIVAMGGREALVAIHEMKVDIWVEASENLLGRVLLSVRPYLYPIAQNEYKAWSKIGHGRNRASTDMRYITSNPAITKEKYSTLFESRWSALSSEKRALRIQGEEARWHFLDRFLGEGIMLRYVGEDRLLVKKDKREKRLVDIVEVTDQKYGYYYYTFFDRETALLLAIQETLSKSESRWYRQNYKSSPPVWTTFYDLYEPMAGVLTPHRLVRSDGGRQVTVYLEVEYNGSGKTLNLSDVYMK